MKKIDLTFLVFSELSDRLAEEFSTEELLRAAQYLIELSKNDFVVKDQSVRASIGGYYSYPIDYALANKQMKILVEETRYQRGLDFLTPEVRQKLSRILERRDESMWEF